MNAIIEQPQTNLDSQSVRFLLQVFKDLINQTNESGARIEYKNKVISIISPDDEVIEFKYTGQISSGLILNS